MTAQNEMDREQMISNDKSLKKQVPPTRFVYEPYGSQWHVEREGKPVTCYIQISRDENHPRWVRLAYLLEAFFIEKINDHPFIELCIKKFIAPK